MTDIDIDPIEELADTLYDGLYAITPYAEPHFADQREGLRNAVQAVLEEAAAQQWIKKQLDQTGIKSMDFRNGLTMELEPAREMVALWVGAARTMLDDAPNYTETPIEKPIEMEVKVAESPERFAFTLQRVGKLTPHEARQKAEARVAELETQLEQAKADLQQSQTAFQSLARRLGMTIQPARDQCRAEYGGPGYTRCELPDQHDGRHDSPLGNLRRATWGGDTDV